MLLKAREINMKNINLLNGDNLELLKTLEDNSIDSIVTDPPYALVSIKKRFGKEGSAPAKFGTDGAFQRASRGFMGKEWDAAVPTMEFWEEVYRVLKPGGHVLSFGGTRTYHRMVVNIEDAGFEIRDQIMWIYGSGFPKSHNIGKAVDKRGGESIGWFGEWLVNWRKENNIPQSKIAELFPSKTGGLTGCVSNWELGSNLPTNEQFNLICKTFNLPFNSLEEAEREFIGTKTSGIGKAFTKDGWGSGSDEVNITKGTSPYEGWGTALKPANEPICVARKPLSENTIAENVLKWGTGGINIDGCRIGTDVISSGKSKVVGGGQLNLENTRVEIEETFSEGRFPANIMFECICDDIIKGEKGEPFSYKGKEYNNKETSMFNGDKPEAPSNYNDKGDIHTNPDCPCHMLDEQSGVSKSTGAIRKKDTETDPSNIDRKHKIGENSNLYAGQEGGASRFFYVAKVSKKERNLGLDEFEEKQQDTSRKEGNPGGDNPRNRGLTKRANIHPTVKPIKLMAYLCRLITPVGGVVLDPFMGSGSTGIAACLEGFNFIGMEMDKEYFKIAEARINNYELHRETK